MSFEQGQRSVTIYLQFENRFSTLTLSEPTFFHLSTLVQSSIRDKLPSGHTYLVQRSNTSTNEYLVQDDHDVLRIEQDDIIKLNNHSNQNNRSYVYLREAPLPYTDPRAQSLPIEVHQQEICFDGNALIEQHKHNDILGQAIIQKFQTVGYIRIAVDQDWSKLYDRCIASAQTFFNQSQDAKNKSAQDCANQGLNTSHQNYQNKFGYGKPNTANKEYFIYRNWLAQPKSKWQQDLSNLFDAQAQLTKAVAHLVLRQLGLSDKIIEDRLLHNSTSPFDSTEHFAYRSMMESFCYHPPSSQARQPKTVHVACAEHGDVSLLTCIPQCVGVPGLETMAWKDGRFRRVESSEPSSSNLELIMFPGEQMQRLSNQFISPTQHRVLFADESFNHNHNVRETDRYSMPFELLVSPDTILRCAEWLNPQVVGPISERCATVETMKDAVDKISVGLISVNKS